MDEIAQHNIKIYEFPDCEDEDEQKVMKKMKAGSFSGIFSTCMLHLDVT